MADHRRNPYVILGIDFGADEEAARTGFAKASRRIRTMDSPVYTVEDLTWALHQVEQMIEDPERAFEVYRIPANPNITDGDIDGVFLPLAQPLPRTTPASTDADVNAVRFKGAHEVIHNALAGAPSIQIPRPYDQKDEIT